MPRPKKQTADYFPHFAKGTSDSKTKFMLETNWGNDGYAFWFKLLEQLCMSDGHYYNYSDTANIMFLNAYTKVDEETAVAILDMLAATGNIDGELWAEGRIIWCDGLVENLTHLYAKRTVSAPKKPPIESFRSRKPQSNVVSGDGNPQSKVKESKVKESKVNSERGADAPALPVRHKRGQYGWVKLSDDEFTRLVTDHGEEMAQHYINYIDESAQQTGNKNKWKDWNLTVRKAIREKWGGGYVKKSGGNYEL